VEKPTTVVPMNDRQTQIRNLLWKEVALKSRPAAFAFSCIAVFIFFYYFELREYKNIIRTACVFVFLANIMRFWVSRKIHTAKDSFEKEINLIRSSIWLNSLSWSVIFAIGAYGLNSSGWHFAIMVTILTGYVASSIVTLSYDKSIFYPFQVLCLFPVIIISLWQYFSGLNPFAHYLVITYSVCYLYQIRQYKDYRFQLMQRFNALLDLEFSFRELKKSQSSLVEQTAKLIHASKISALSAMAGGLAHEVNNSLMIILGSTQQIQREMNKTDVISPSITEKFRQSTDAIMKIKGVIEGLKYFSLEMEPQPKEVVPLKEVIERTLSYTHELLKAHDIRFSSSEVPDVKIYCHPFQITQILFNLTRNADDAIMNLPSEKRWLKYEFVMYPEYILIKVMNGGPQIPPELHMRLFQPFFSTKEVNQGTGLSLSTSKGIAMDHKGDLYFEDNQNTTFVLKLPLA
jgi:signal transduction histidine kinase